jgi:hypothetical protein
MGKEKGRKPQSEMVNIFYHSRAEMSNAKKRASEGVDSVIVGAITEMPDQIDHQCDNMIRNLRVLQPRIRGLVLALRRVGARRVGARCLGARLERLQPAHEGDRVGHPASPDAELLLGDANHPQRLFQRDLSAEGALQQRALIPTTNMRPPLVDRAAALSEHRTRLRKRRFVMHNIDNQPDIGRGAHLFGEQDCVGVQCAVAAEPASQT